MTAFLRFFAAAIANVVALEVFIGVFVAPVLIYGSDDVLLAWGWIAPFVGLPLAWIAGRVTHGFVHSALSRALLATDRRWLKTGSVTLLALACVAGVGQFMRTYGNASVRWSEEVRLSGGQSIVVTRTARGNVFGHSRMKPEGWLPEEFTIEASSTLAAPLRTSLRPVLLDRDPASGGFYVLAEPLDCGAWTTLGRPAPPYFQYLLDAHGWTRTDVDRRLLGRSANLLVLPRFTGEERMLSAEQVSDRNNAVPVDIRPRIRPVSGC